ncbi:MAG: bifunctional [glutamate--ammonia ligase]-adenylyl-L-tyrosine phosphorylase/[glutamate--ammonia-ligase] adenylyltransferase, partial [Verrucomicrobiae bacterium]|nr:bifunctional [glutamate--ammonia ligase]-adenylyl-L-tyrosine phosphorylase/[glutamate--ammonia-ligase] adenylyltransferase [Verrucomicrobiae bacterium]
MAAAQGAPALDKLSSEHLRVLAALFSGSPALAHLLVENPGWVAALEPDAIVHGRRFQGFQREVGLWLDPLIELRDYETALARLRQFKQRELLRIAARDLGGLAEPMEVTRELSDLADACLDAVLRVCTAKLTAQFGRPFYQNPKGEWEPIAFCVVGLGKLGAQELNYSSDVDLMFVYTEEGYVFKQPPRAQEKQSAAMTAHQFFNRLAEAFVTELTRATADGTLYRGDLRHRREGDSGPLTRSLAGYENYYAQWGQTWERMMLIRARGVAGDKSLAAEFVEMVQPFRFPRSNLPGALSEIGQMKKRIETEVLRADELDRNIKLGRGGIREIEFIVQALQLLHAGKIPFLQISQTLPALDKLAQYNLLGLRTARQLQRAYCFLRKLEHRLQMEQGLQTHTIPASAHARKRLARLMGFRSVEKFEHALRAHTRNVRRAFDSVLKLEPPRIKSELPEQFDGAEEQWREILAKHWFRDPEKGFRILKEFVEGPGYVHVSPRTAELARGLVPRLLAMCRKDDPKAPAPTLPPKTLSDPDRVLARLDSFIAAYGARKTLLELWHSNPAIFELMLLLFDRSEYLAELAIRSPDLVDMLVTGERLVQRKTSEEILRELQRGSEDADQFAWLRRYHEAELMRIGLRDILGLVDFEQNLTELTALADACIQYALEVVLRSHGLECPPFAIIGLGKLGGCEINYGSDLDLMFVADRKAKDLAALQRLAVEVLELLSRRTEHGIVFHTDVRLRPDGEKGLLVNTLDAHEQYYRHRAQLWEIQALTRTRYVAGNLQIGEEFQQLAASLTDFRLENVAAGFPLRSAGMTSPQKGFSAAHAEAVGATRLRSAGGRGLAAYRPDWKAEIHKMRMRIERDRTPPGKDHLAIKTGKGGLMDAEFIAQALCMQ